jgi:hypothetical protein
MLSGGALYLRARWSGGRLSSAGCSSNSGGDAKLRAHSCRVVSDEDKRLEGVDVRHDGKADGETSLTRKEGGHNCSRSGER